MKLISLIFVAFFATISAQTNLLGLCSLGSDVSISASFSAESGVSSLQSVSIKNLRSGSGFSNSLQNVSFTVEGLGVQASYGNNQPSAQVGTILAGVTGWGHFNARAYEGSYAVFVTAFYRVEGSREWKFACKEFSLQVGGHWKRSVESVDASSFADSVELNERTDLTITPTGFQGEDGTNVWNSFVITTGSSAITNVTWAVTPSDFSVIVTYPGIGNYVASIAASTVYTTSVAFSGNAGDYTLNCTARYRKSSTGTTWQYYQVSRPLDIAGGDDSSSVKRVAEVLSVKQREAVAVDASAHGVQYVRADFALGAAVAGIAVVAAVAIVGAMVVIRRRNPETSSA